MTIYVERDTEGIYDILDTFINENVSLNTKTTYTQDITAVFKGFTNDFSVKATPNNIRILGYFGYTDQFTPAKIQKRAKLYIGSEVYKEGLITLKDTSWINGAPSLFSLEFSDGQKNLTEILGEDTLADLNDGSGDVVWTSNNIQKALQSVQTATGDIRWFVPLVSTERIFSISADEEAIQLDNIAYIPEKPIDSENILLQSEVRPAVFMSDILAQVNKKYDIKIDPTPYVGNITQLTDLCTLCPAEIAIKNVKADVTKTDWDDDNFLEERFDIIIRPDINGFELNYLGYGGGGHHDASFDMTIALMKKPYPNNKLLLPGSLANKDQINSIEAWEVTEFGEKKNKLSYEVVEDTSENKSNILKIRIGLDVFTPEGANQPSTSVKPLICVFVSAGELSDWKYTFFDFAWWQAKRSKFIKDNIQSISLPVTVNLFEGLADMKVIDFVKSIYTMFGYKKFKEKVLNDFYYVSKTVDSTSHVAFRRENDLTPYADLSKVPKKVNPKYDGYNLKHADSEYQQNVKFQKANNDMQYGQLKYPLTGRPKSEFKIETKFTAPVFNPVISDTDQTVFTFYPFGSDFQLNEAETRFIYDTITNEFPIFYYNGPANISTPYAFLDADSKTLKAISKYHKISHKNSRIKTGLDNYITSLFNIITSDYIDQNTLYVQAFKTFIEDTLSGKKLIHTIDLDLPNIQIQKFEDSDEIIIKETRFSIMESNLSLTGGKSKLTLLNK